MKNNRNFVVVVTLLVSSLILVVACTIIFSYVFRRHAPDIHRIVETHKVDVNDPAFKVLLSQKEDAERTFMLWMQWFVPPFAALVIGSLSGLLVSSSPFIYSAVSLLPIVYLSMAYSGLDAWILMAMPLVAGFIGLLTSKQKLSYMRRHS
jgi:hypothetical protein